MADPRTVEVYERNAAEYRRARRVDDPGPAARFAAGIAAGGLRLDVGCGPGLYLDLLGRPLVASDVTQAMCLEARSSAPDVPVVRHDLEALPFRPGTFAGVWASKCLQHLPAASLPVALAELQRSMTVGGRLDLTVFQSEAGGVFEQYSPASNDLPGRLFTWWEVEPLTWLLEGAGYDVDDVTVDTLRVDVTARRARTLPDIVGPGMRMLVCGLNPSVYAADAGVPYARPGNRFWPAAVAAGIASVDRDPWHALRAHGTGFTDLVKRASTGAAELTQEEYQAGLARLEHLCSLLAPAAVAFCGLTGWRAATRDRRATAGWQDRTVGGVRAYVLPNPSGLNAHTSIADITSHLRTAADCAPS